jgi:hypothetical protein
MWSKLKIYIEYNKEVSMLFFWVVTPLNLQEDSNVS